jgi:multiple antibiotic resistance protein
VLLDHFHLFATVFAGFFAIMNPLANTPIFLGLTSDADEKQRRAIATQATLVAFVVVALFSALGQVIFNAFGITVAAFRIAGGIVVFMIGYRMLQGEHSKVQHTKRARDLARNGEPSTQEDTGSDTELGELSVGVTPLAVPILAGPGTIATAVGFTGSGSWTKVAVTIFAFGLLCLGTWLCFVMGQKLVSFLGRPFLTVVTRLMGLILAVIGVQMFLHGIQAAGFGVAG